MRRPTLAVAQIGAPREGCLALVNRFTARGKTSDWGGNTVSVLLGVRH